LVPNLWANWAEIPGNQKDDDGNGFVDDFQGYDVRNAGSGPGNGGSHGTSVSAIAGARGNNIIGVTGVNWNVKLMPITNVDALTEVVAGYEYALKMRRLYNTSGGKKGAFIVCTNASFGRDNRFPSFFPAWCDAYESLGNEGVLSAGATTNSNSNVDSVGDLPSTCESEYLMVVTNVTSISGNKATQAGFGAKHVDLGAPGDGTVTAENGPTYGTFEGTSAATPHVAGAIALTYSFNCNVVAEDRLSNPAACARRVRDLIMDNVVPNTTLAGITSTGGRLDLGTTLAEVRGLCKGAIGPLQVLKVETDPQKRFKIYYQAPSSMTTYRFRVFNMLGQLMYEQPTTPKQFEANIIEFDANILPDGIYVFSINAGNNIISRKFAKF
jgi:serine protease